MRLKIKVLRVCGIVFALEEASTELTLVHNRAAYVAQLLHSLVQRARGCALSGQR